MKISLTGLGSSHPTHVAKARAHDKLLSLFHFCDVFFDRTSLLFHVLNLRSSTLLLVSLANSLPCIAMAIPKLSPKGHCLCGDSPWSCSAASDLYTRKVARWHPTCCPTCYLSRKSAILCANPLTTVAADSSDSLNLTPQVGRSVRESPYHGGSRLVRLVKSKEKSKELFSL